MDRRVALTAALGAHLVVAVSHGAAHGLVPVPLPAWQNALVVATTFVGPTVGAALAWREHPLGAPLFALSMAGALLLGGSLHFLVESPDHVHAIPTGPWQLPFRVSAAGVAVTAGLGAAVGAWSWRAQ